MRSGSGTLRVDTKRKLAHIFHRAFEQTMACSFAARPALSSADGRVRFDLADDLRKAWTNPLRAPLRVGVSSALGGLKLS